MTQAAHSQATPISVPTVGIDWALMLLRIVAASTVGFLVILLWMVAAPTPYAGLLQLLGQDTGATRQVVGGTLAAFFGADMGQMLRGLHPRRGMVLALSGQAVVAVVAVFYALKGQIFLTGLTAYVGVFWMSLISLWAVAQHQTEKDHKRRLLQAKTSAEQAAVTAAYRAPRYEVKKLLIPSLGVIMFLTGLGQIMRPESPVVAFIESSIGLFYYVVMLAWLIVGGGFIRLNHIQAKWLYAALFGYYMFCFMIVLLIPSGTEVSPLFIGCHLLIALESLCIICLQTDFHEAA